jgi:hypothetical protein
MNVVILLTAAIDPRGTPFVKVRDPVSRLNEYTRALRWYRTQLPATPIVFCENTGSDLGNLRNEAGGGSRAEILQWTMPEMLCSKGKGLGELGIMDHAHHESTVIQASDIVLKITGRYRLLNVRDMIAGLRSVAPFDIAADFHCALSRADSRIFAYSRRFFSEFLSPRKAELDDNAGVYLEHSLARAMHAALSTGAPWTPLPVEPDFDAVSGTGGRAYARGPARRVLRRVRRSTLNWLLRR